MPQGAMPTPADCGINCFEVKICKTMSKKVWWLVVHGVNMTHLWDSKTFNRRKDALSYFDTVTANCAQVIRQEAPHPLLPASKNKTIRVKNG